MANPSTIRGRVVLVRFPFDDLSGSKVRPAVCLTEPVGPHHHVILAFVTSQVEATPLPTDVVLDERDSEFGQTGLRRPSTIRLHRLMTAPISIVHRELGRLSDAQKAAVDARLLRLFELS